MPTLISIRYDEQQLLDLATKARVQGARRGYLHKADPKLKKLTQRWCCVYQNFFFYFESESCPKPLGVVFLEGCTCRPVEHAVEGAFCISSANEGPNNKTFFFCARTDKERDEWMGTLINANMTRLLHELEELRERCTQLEGMLSTTGKEIEHLKLANQAAQEDLLSLRKSSIQLSPRRRLSSCQRYPSSTPDPSSPDHLEEQARILQGYIRGWLIRRRWKKIVRQYLDSPSAATVKKRNQLIWKFVASEEDYVSQLTMLNEEFRQQCEIAACSRKPPVTLEQSNAIFRNSEELLLFHQLFLRGLHSRIEKWPVVVLGDVLKLFIPMMAIYHQFTGNHSHALELMLSLQSEPSFKTFLDHVQARPSSQGMFLEELLVTPLKRISSCMQDLQELKAHTPTEHVDYNILHDVITELEIIQKTVTDEVCMSENIRQVLKVEHRIEGGCEVLLDKEQTLIREGVLHHVRLDHDRSGTISRSTKLRSQPRYCFLFSKHLLVTTRTQKKPQEVYRLAKENGILPLGKCHVYEHQGTEFPELYYRALRIECSMGGDKIESLLLMANSVTEKAQWMADFSQCMENEKQNKILQSQSLGEPVELSSRFIRYSTFRTGKEQLVNCGNLESLLQRLVKVSYFGLDFLNTFLMTFPLYTNAHTIMDFLQKTYQTCLERREKVRRGSVNPEDAVRDARTVTVDATLCRSPRSPRSPPYGKSLTVPRQNGIGNHPPPSRTASESAMETSVNISGIFFALKHWICKHFHHFQEDVSLTCKVEELLEHAIDYPLCMPNEKSAIMEVNRLYSMQKNAKEEPSPVLKLMHAEPNLPTKPFEVVLEWGSLEAAEQLCIIENTLFSRIEERAKQKSFALMTTEAFSRNVGKLFSELKLVTDNLLLFKEILRYFITKGGDKAKSAPNLTAIFDHFNRMSLFFMWSVASQDHLVERTKVLEFLISLAGECLQLNNFSSLMQIMSAIQHGSISRFKTAWECIPKNLKQQFRSLVRLTCTDGRFKELRMAMRRAHPPFVPYLGIVLNELSGVVEALPTYIEGDLVNFTKMRRFTRLVTGVLQYQKEPYEFAFNPEISKILLCTPIPGNEDHLYKYVEAIDDS